jgi:hypothetical protein
LLIGSRNSLLFVLTLLMFAGCSSAPGLPHVTSIGGAHVRAQWESELAGGRAVPVAPPGMQQSAVARAARRGRAQLVDVRFYRARSGSAAPAIVLAVSDPAEFLVHRLRGFLTRLRTVNGLYGDDYVGVVDSRGRFVWENGRAHLPGTFAGSLWIRPDLDSCSPVVHSQPVGAKPPPCPAG